MHCQTRLLMACGSKAIVGATIVLAACFPGQAEGPSEAAAAGTPTLRIALVQVAPNVDPEINLERATGHCREAKRQGADLVLFPEMFNVGYQTNVDFDKPDNVAQWRAKAWRRDGDQVNQFRKLSAELELAIAITYLQELDDGLQNATTLIDRKWTILLTYAKVHTCRFFPMEGALRPGEDFFVADLEAAAGPVKIGIMTCYDREFPESARILMLKGAEIILTPNACGLDHLRLKQFQIRAWENSVVAAMANYASGHGNGRSCVYAADGEEILLTDSREGVYVVDIDLQKLRETREKTFWGNAWRRPQKYKSLVSPKIQEPFRRTDAYDRPNTQPAK